jgi:hypothetical protein
VLLAAAQWRAGQSIFIQLVALVPFTARKPLNAGSKGFRKRSLHAVKG